MALGTSGEIRDIQNETWSNIHRYLVAHDIRIATIKLVQHVPSHVIMAGYRTLIAYQGQPTTCYGCNETGHLYQVCPQRRRARALNARTTKTAWAEVAATGTNDTQDNMEINDGVGMAGVAADVPEVAEGPTTTPRGGINRQHGVRWNR